MLNNLLILAIVLIVTGVMIRVARVLGEKCDDIDPSDRVYRLHAIYRWIPLLAAVILNPLLVLDAIPSLNPQYLFVWSNLNVVVYELLVFNAAVFIGWLYLNRTKVYFDGDCLVRTTLFGTRKIPIDRIYQIVNNASRGNPGAAMTKVYARVGGKRRRITIEAMIDGYDTLIREIEYRAPRARRVEK